jgi:hypothetical protein
MTEYSPGAVQKWPSIPESFTCSVAGDSSYKLFSPGFGWVIRNVNTGVIVWTCEPCSAHEAIIAAEFDGFEFA